MWCFICLAWASAEVLLEPIFFVRWQIFGIAGEQWIFFNHAISFFIYFLCVSWFCIVTS